MVHTIFVFRMGVCIDKTSIACFISAGAAARDEQNYYTPLARI
jgi:hypothetical protein